MHSNAATKTSNTHSADLYEIQKNFSITNPKLLNLNKREVMTQEANQDYKILTRSEIDEQLRQLPGWILESTSNTTALTHTYKFNTFIEAIAFMQATAPAIDKLNHHPEWQNVYNKLTIRTTSHDRNNQLTVMDFRLARLLDEHFSEQG